MSKIVIKTRNFFSNSRRLLRHAKMPSRRELSISTKMSALGVVIIGLIGYILSLLFNAIISAIQNRAA
ncbi:MAG: protein translocase SEC61 complex subunit gamma [Candidatus Heimdallarchaeota archaeon]|nr:protein translocase SEC61 complex subunit gamma [Candidatus Heimdallarchaeota archaeon]MCK4953994.1 protein translocase SEC61 complex subunit gamma [Candidatus Heimdallarchaeota archaeon]